MTFTRNTIGCTSARSAMAWLSASAFLASAVFSGWAFAQTAPATGPDPTSAAIEGMSVEARIDLAEQCLQNNRVKDAQDLLQPIVEKDRQSLRAVRLLANAYERLAQTYKSSAGRADDLKLAEDYFQAANNMLLFLAQAHVKSGEERLAEPLLTVILSRPPSKADSLGVDRFRNWSQRYAQAQLTMARLLSATDRQAFAMDRYKDFLKNPFAPQDLLATAHVELAMIYRKSSLPAQAIDALESARKANPENGEVYAEMARVHLGRGDLQKAKQSAATAIDKGSTNPEYHNLLATVLFALRDLNAARESAMRSIDLARETLRKTPDHQPTWTALSKYYRTYQDILQAQVKDKGELTARLSLAQAIQEAAEVDRSSSAQRAWEVLNSASEQDKGNPALLKALASAAVEAHQYASATAACNRLLEQDPNDAEARKILAGLPGSQPAG